MAEADVPGLLKPGVYRVVTERSVVRFVVAGLAGRIVAEVAVQSGFFAVGADGLVREVRTVLDTANLKAGPMVARSLRGRSGLDIARFPTVSFVSTRVMQDGPRLEIEGGLSMRGQTHPAVFRGEIVRAAPRRVVVQVDGVVDRMRYGMTVGRPLYAKEASIRIRAVAVRDEAR